MPTDKEEQQNSIDQSWSKGFAGTAAGKTDMFGKPLPDSKNPYDQARMTGATGSKKPPTPWEIDFKN